METGCLTKDAYTDELSKRSHFTLAHKRDEIYQIYILYEGRKSARGERDAADRTYSIIRGFNQKVAKLVLLDRVYVDVRLLLLPLAFVAVTLTCFFFPFSLKQEAQDNLIIDCSRELNFLTVFLSIVSEADWLLVSFVSFSHSETSRSIDFRCLLLRRRRCSSD